MNLVKKVFLKLLIAFVGMGFTSVAAQNGAPQDSMKNRQPTPDKISVAIFERIISDAHGNKRTDQNILGNFRLCSLLRLEVGYRHGERPSIPNSYYHYKIELQTKYFWKTLHFIARLSDNVINSPAPNYRKTNKIFIAEARYPLTRTLQLYGGVGYVFSATQNYVRDILPTGSGIRSNSPVYRLALKYSLPNKSFFEAACGTYDVFNPYSLNQPFLQIITEQELSEFCAFYSYFRYQFNNSVYTPLNYFLCLGVRLHVLRG